jgi:hypothetical protein
MPVRLIDDLVKTALGELQHRVLVLIAEKDLLEDGIEKLKQKVSEHRCGNPIDLKD